MITSLNLSKILQYWGTPFITILYRCFLNRDPEPEGLKYYLGRLEQGIDRHIIIEQFLKSSEVTYHFEPKELLLIRLEVNRLRALHTSGFLPVARLFSQSMPKNQRIMLNRLNELQFQFEKPSIPSRNEFLKASPRLLPKMINQQQNSIVGSLNNSEKLIFKKILKQF